MCERERVCMCVCLERVCERELCMGLLMCVHGCMIPGQPRGVVKNMPISPTCPSLTHTHTTPSHTPSQHIHSVTHTPPLPPPHTLFHIHTPSQAQAVHCAPALPQHRLLRAHLCTSVCVPSKGTGCFSQAELLVSESGV